MKILILAPYMYDKDLPQFKKNKTGFGLMIKDIMTSLSAYNEVYLLTHVITKKVSHDKFVILKHTWLDIFSSLSLPYILDGLKVATKFKQKWMERLRYFFYFAQAGYVKKMIKIVNPDVINIHQIGYTTLPYIKVCKEMHVIFFVTLHGLIENNEYCPCITQEKELEKEFLQKIDTTKVPIVVISQGIKNTIVSEYQVNNPDHIHVITNGTNVYPGETTSKLDLRRMYNIPSDDKILLCIGNINENKNQTSLVNAFSVLKKQIQEKTTILFLGKDSKPSFLQKQINRLDLSTKLIICGFIERNKMFNYWKQANLNVLVSIKEGFGLSIIEGFVYGVPTLLFEDLFAVKDLFHKNALFLVKDRTTESLAQGIQEALQMSWDNDWIKEYSKKYSKEKMTDNYQKLFLSLVIDRFN